MPKKKKAHQKLTQKFPPKSSRKSSGDLAGILLSGGLDSAAQLALANEPISFALTFLYGQRSAKKELAAAKALSRWFGIPHLILDLKKLTNLWGDAGGALLNKTRAIPQPGLKDLDNLSASTASAAAVWVPNRNGVFLNIAASVAEAKKVSKIYLGFNAEEAATFPDNSAAFMRAATNSLSFSTKNGVQVASATVQWQKWQTIVALAKWRHSVTRATFPLQLIWSCYELGRSHCGLCESCMRLKRALHLAHEAQETLDLETTVQISEWKQNLFKEGSSIKRLNIRGQRK